VMAFGPSSALTALRLAALYVVKLIFDYKLSSFSSSFSSIFSRFPEMVSSLTLCLQQEDSEYVISHLFYHWTAVNLAIQLPGDGEHVRVSILPDDGDAYFCILDGVLTDSTLNFAC
jgi:hypothetical protein